MKFIKSLPKFTKFDDHSNRGVKFKIWWKVCYYQNSGNKNTVTKLALYYKDTDKINAGLPRWTRKTNSWMTVDGICFRSLQSSVVKKYGRRKKRNLMLIGPCIMLIVEEQKTNLMALAIFFF